MNPRKISSLQMQAYCTKETFWMQIYTVQYSSIKKISKDANNISSIVTSWTNKINQESRKYNHRKNNFRWFMWEQRILSEIKFRSSFLNLYWNSLRLLWKLRIEKIRRSRKTRNIRQKMTLFPKQMKTLF